MAIRIIVWKPNKQMMVLSSVLLVLALWSHDGHCRVSAWTAVPILATRHHPLFGTTTKSSTTQLHYLNDGLDDADLIRQAQQQQQQQQQQQKKPLKDSTKTTTATTAATTTTQRTNNNTTTTTTTTRASIDGVSLASQGFWAMLRLASTSLDNDSIYLPLQVTDDPADAAAATSPEALTLIQLLSGVDMAGAMLPPELLARCVVLECETILKAVENEDDSMQTDTSNSKQDPLDIAQTVLRDVQTSLPDQDVPYSQAHEWLQARATLPTVSLDEVVVVTQDSDTSSNDTTSHPSSFVWKCQIRNVGSLTLQPTNEILEAVLYQFSPQISLAFVSLALALRYQAPLTVQIMNNNNSGGTTWTDLQHRFPLLTSRQSLQATSSRVQENIVRSFEIHKLTGALQIARQRGDTVAAAKIRTALDELDRLDDLPTTTTGDGASDTTRDGYGETNQDDGDDLDVLQ